MRDAPAHELETDWIEWKGDVDLSAKRWQAEIARQVLGFANRDPERAARALEGTAVLLLGVEPGRVAGVQPIDSAELQQGVGRYLPPHGPEWDPHYEDLDGVAVLCVTVEVPRRGDDIWTFRHGYNAWRDGDVFIRRPGQTDRPTAAEMTILQRRAAASARQLALDLRLWEPTSVAAIDLSDEAIARWQEAERTRLLAALPSPGAERVVGVLATLSLERRSRDEYLEQVDAYLESAVASCEAEAAARAVASKLGRVQFAVANRTEHNFAGVAVEVRIGGRVAAFFDAGEVRAASSFPSAPRPWGDMSHLTGPTIPAPLLRRPPRIRNGRIDNSGSTRVQFDPLHVRPHMLHALPPVYVVPMGPPFPDDVVARWQATSTSVDGFDDGEVTVPLDATPFPLDAVMSRRKG